MDRDATTDQPPLLFVAHVGSYTTSCIQLYSVELCCCTCIKTVCSLSVCWCDASDEDFERVRYVGKFLRVVACLEGMY